MKAPQTLKQSSPQAPPVWCQSRLRCAENLTAVSKISACHAIIHTDAAGVPKEKNDMVADQRWQQ